MPKRISKRLGWASGLAAVATLSVGAGPAVAATDVQLAPNPESSVIAITGDGANDAVSVSLSGETITVTNPAGATTADPNCTQVNPTTVTCPRDPADPAPPDPASAPVERVFANLGAGDDSFSTDAFETGIEGGPGADTLNGGPLEDFLGGGDGDDVLDGNTDSDTVLGAAGTDAVAGGTGPDSVDGGEGNDYADGGPGHDFVDGGLGDDNVLGGEGNDFLVDGSERGFGGGLIIIRQARPVGTDNLDGQGGFDSTDYARETDLNISLDGQANDGAPGENDNVQVEAVFTGDGNDTLTGNDGENRLVGNAGNDQIRGLGGVDELNGGTEDDFLDGGTGRDDVYCGPGYDSVLAHPDDEVSPTCERTGAEIAGDTATVNKKHRAKIRVRCPAEEGASCTGNLRLFAAGKTVAKGKFEVAQGQSKNAQVKLTKKGKKLLAKNAGSLLASAEARTNEPYGVSTQDERVLLQRKARKK